MGSSRRRNSTRAKRARTPTSTLLKPPALARQLAEAGCLLRNAYAACVTCQRALERQNAEQDRDFAHTLQWAVADLISRAADQLRALAEGAQQ